MGSDGPGSGIGPEEFQLIAHITPTFQLREQIRAAVQQHWKVVNRGTDLRKNLCFYVGGVVRWTPTIDARYAKQLVLDTDK